MIGGLNIDAWITIMTVIMVLGMLLFTKVRTDVVFMAAIGTLFVTGVLDLKESFAGFSSSAVVTTGILAVVVAGLRYTGVLQWIVINVFGLPDSYSKALLRMMIPVGLLSAFINNTTVTALFVDVLKQWARKLNIAPSKLFIPLAYVVLLGGVCTVIGTTSNIVISDLYHEVTGRQMDMFLPFVPGMACLFVGMTLIIVMRRWLPERVSPESAFETMHDYTVELLVPSDNPNFGKTLGEAGLFHVNGGSLIGLYRFDNLPAAVSESEFIMGGDRLIYAGKIEEILDLKQSHKLVVSDHHIYSMSEMSRFFRLCMAYVNFDSDLIGKTIGDTSIEQDYELILVAVSRCGKRLDVAPRDVILQAGDALLFECPRKMKITADQLISKLQFSDFQEFVRLGPETILSSLIMLAMLVLTALNVVSLLKGTILAALAMLLCRCCGANQAMNSVNWRVLTSMAGSIVIGTAISKTGIAQNIAYGILGICGPHPLMMMIAICILAMLITQLVMNVAAGAMFFPIMYEVAIQANCDPTTFILALMIAVNTAFATPIGAPPNMLVYGPGDLRFTDFMRVGIPLAILVAITGIVTVCMMFPITPLPLHP